MFGKKGKWTAALAAAALLSGAIGWQADAAGEGGAASPASPYRIVVLGDSVSVGYEPGAANTADVYGYADRLFDQALLHGRAEESSFAILGLTSEGLEHLLQGAKDRKPLTASQLQDFSKYGDSRIPEQAGGVAARTAELADALSQANVVVMTIGGNDFLDDMRALAESGDKDALAQFTQNFDSKLNNYADHVKDSVQLLRELAPSATVELADQYLPLPEKFDADLYKTLKDLTDKLADRLDDLAKELNGADAGSAATAGTNAAKLDIVHVRDLFVGKELSLTHIYDHDVHPNQAGYAAIAERFADSLWGEYTVLNAAGKGTAAQPLAPAIYIDGKPLHSANAPKLKYGTTFLALSDVGEATGAELKWDNATKTAIFSKNGNVVKITIGAKNAVVNGKSQPLAQAAYLDRSKTYVPLAAIANGLQYQVVYRAKLHTAFIHS